jgi:hypothetical protein
MEISGQLDASIPLETGEWAPGTFRIGGWVGPRPSLDAVYNRKKSYSCLESNPNFSVVQLVLHCLS